MPAADVITARLVVHTHPKKRVANSIRHFFLPIRSTLVKATGREATVMENDDVCSEIG